MIEQPFGTTSLLFTKSYHTVSFERLPYQAAGWPVNSDGTSPYSFLRIAAITQHRRAWPIRTAARAPEVQRSVRLRKHYRHQASRARGRARPLGYSRAVGGADVGAGGVRRAVLVEVLGAIVGELQARAGGGGGGGRVAVGVGGRGGAGAVGVVVGHRARV